VVIREISGCLNSHGDFKIIFKQLLEGLTKFAQLAIWEISPFVPMTLVLSFPFDCGQPNFSSK
jgi:hypothetical protein